MRRSTRGGTAWDLSVIAVKTAPYLVVTLLQVVLYGSLAFSALLGLYVIARAEGYGAPVPFLAFGGVICGGGSLVGHWLDQRRRWRESIRHETGRLTYRWQRWLRRMLRDD